MAQLICRKGETLVTHCAKGCGSCTAGYRCPNHGKNWPVVLGESFFADGITGSGATCKECSKKLVNCTDCRGQKGKRGCKVCAGSGEVCVDHGKKCR